MFGTNFPRTYKGAMAGYKYTGEINIPALLQEAIREFLTGPTMCVTPIVVLALAKKAGKTVDTHTENIFNLSYILKQTRAENEVLKEDDFIKNVLKDLIAKTSGKEANELDINKNELEDLIEKGRLFSIMPKLLIKCRFCGIEIEDDQKSSFVCTKCLNKFSPKGDLAKINALKEEQQKQISEKRVRRTYSEGPKSRCGFIQNYDF